MPAAAAPAAGSAAAPAAPQRAAAGALAGSTGQQQAGSTSAVIPPPAPGKVRSAQREALRAGGAQPLGNGLAPAEPAARALRGRDAETSSRGSGGSKGSAGNREPACQKKRARSRFVANRLLACFATTRHDFCSPVVAGGLCSAAACVTWSCHAVQSANCLLCVRRSASLMSRSHSPGPGETRRFRGTRARSRDLSRSGRTRAGPHRRCAQRSSSTPHTASASLATWLHRLSCCRLARQTQHTGFSACTAGCSANHFGRKHLATPACKHTCNLKMPLHHLLCTVQGSALHRNKVLQI